MILLLGAALFAGLCVTLLVFGVAGAFQTAGQPMSAMISDAQRRMKREKLQQDSTLMGFAMTITAVILPLVRQLPLDSTRETLSQRYARAGWPGGLSDEEVLALSLLLGLVLAIPLCLFIAVINPIAAPVGLVAILAGPGLVSSTLNSKGVERELSISRNFPFALDLLVLTMRAGASLQIAIERVATDYASQPIGEEFRSIMTDIELGVTTREAFQNFVQRVPLPVVRTFVDDLIQAEELGRPLADTLERLSDQVRVRRVQDAVDTAGKAKVMVLVPGMLVFVATLILLFSPFIVRFYYGGYEQG